MPSLTQITPAADSAVMRRAIDAYSDKRALDHTYALLHVIEGTLDVSRIDQAQREVLIELALASCRAGLADREALIQARFGGEHDEDKRIMRRVVEELRPAR